MDKLTEKINEWDPGRFMPHAPDDEYETEIDEVRELLKGEFSQKEIGSKVFEIFHNSLGSDRFRYTIDECMAFALELLSLA